MRLTLLVLWGLLAAGCSNAYRVPEFSVPAGGYAAAFDATREVLREYRFELERVDARAGVITTRAKSTAGMATPWDREQTTFKQEVEDLLNNQRRIARVQFRAEGAEPGGPMPPEAPLIGRVEVTVYRVQTPGLRPSSRAIVTTNAATDPELLSQRIGASFEVEEAEDRELAWRLARRIHRRAQDLQRVADAEPPSR
jgi:hypothetical protein